MTLSFRQWFTFPLPLLGRADEVIE